MLWIKRRQNNFGGFLKAPTYSFRDSPIPPVLWRRDSMFGRPRLCAGNSSNFILMKSHLHLSGRPHWEKSLSVAWPGCNLGLELNPEERRFPTGHVLRWHFRQLGWISAWRKPWGWTGPSSGVEGESRELVWLPPRSWVGQSRQELPEGDCQVKRQSHHC